MTKKRAISWIVIFLVMIASPSVTFFFVEELLDTTNYEKREAVSKPVLSMENYRDFPKKYEEWFDDNIPYRNQLVRFNNSIDYFLFQATGDRVALGNDGWLFYCDEGDGNPLKQSLGFRKYTKGQLKKITKNLLEVEHVLKNQGIEFVLFIAPNKETVYREKIKWYQIEDVETGVDQLVRYLRDHTDLRVIYPKKEILDAKKDYPNLNLYYKLDTHWNDVGGYVGASCLAEELGVKMPELSELSIASTSISGGDLSDMLNIAIKNGDLRYTISGVSENVTKCDKWDMDTEFIFRTPGSDPRRLFVCRDSYSRALAPQIASQFENSIFVHRNSFQSQQIFDYDADVFVLELVERYSDILSAFKISSRQE